jgi:hypothetical protein
MSPTLYLETSVISYLAARPARDTIQRARQELTHAWWSTRRVDFDLVVSQLVLREAAAGDPDAAARRKVYLDGLPLLDLSPAAVALARSLHRIARLPEQAAADGLHIALATVHGIDYLMTWNLRHIANAELRPAVEATCRRAGFAPPIICTPDELMGI